MIDLTDYAHTAAQRGWGAGWPSCAGAKLSGLAVARAPRSGVGVSVHRRIALLVELLFTETERRGYLLRSGQCWGYACRAIAGMSVASNHCLTGDTKVVTYDGLVAIRDLAGTTATLLTRDPLGTGQRGRWVEAPIRAYGAEPTYEIVLSRGGARKVVRATGPHRWFAQRKSSTYDNGRSRYLVRTDERTTVELRPGDRLAGCLPPPMPPRIAPTPYGIAHGAVFGDGTLQPSGSRSGPSAKVNLWGHDVELLRYFPADCPTSAVETPNGVCGVQVRSLPAYFRRLPSLDESSAYLAGYVAADGHVRDAEVRLCSRTRDHLEFAALVAARLGIACREPTVQKNAHNPWVEDAETWSLAFVSATVPDWLLLRNDQREAWAEPREGRSPSWKVESVTPTGESEEVFCATVDGFGAFTLDGWLLTGNSWALAIDINSLANPYQFPRRTDMPTWMPLLWNRYGFAWGGNYNNDGSNGKADSMHYEFMGTPADADAMTALASSELTGEFVPVGGSGSSRKDDPVAVIPITVAADNTFRSAVMAEAGGDSIVVARAWITLGSTWGNTSYTITALDGGGRPMMQRRFDVPNNNTRVVELPGGCKLATVEGRTDAKAIPAAALVCLNR
jgi:LAGLIDADG-like domain